MTINSVKTFIDKQFEDEYICEGKNNVVECESLENNKYNCKICNFHTDNKKDYNKHIETIKHKNIIDFENKTKEYICKNCDKKYMSRNGLWWHQKKCININQLTNNNQNGFSNEMFMILFKQNNEIKEIILEQNKQILNLLKNNFKPI